ncbi:FAD-binding oxidoreductase [Chitinophaga horti]|uniref:FAD-binding oxidoreductase n=1 Tax=Chitinophaga horti TaxID=2920382 RepID=A0ABY6J2R0_9BACT|nr:FAD-dependent oxidoreductase [Chitinophaga horti]UYQ93930.1 FAD-binding oxidoreductase [Chitinophaga horti]
MISYWERQSLLQYNDIILGGGITGLSTAISLKERHPGRRIAVFERGILPTGASTRNAGFACIGSLTEILADLKTMPAADIVDLVALRKDGLCQLRERLGDERIGYRENGSYELLSAKEVSALEHIDEVNELLWPVLGMPAYLRADHKIRDFGFNTTALIENNCEGELHSGKMMRALIDLAIEKGIEIKTGCEVLAYDENAGGITITVQRQWMNESVRFQAQRLAICTNAFAKQLLPGEDITPGRGQVLVTHPIPTLPFKGVYHFDEGYYYFRELEGRILFGGGRNFDFEGETTTDFELSEQIQRQLEEKLRTIIIPDIPFTVDMRWSGIMAFGASKRPIVKQLSPQLFVAARMGGMGVAIGTAVAKQLAALMD